MIAGAFETLFVLVAVHFICDYPLQGSFLSSAKKDGPLAAWHLFGHSMIHGAGVFFVTGSMTLACIEVGAHCMIDHGKNRGRFNFAADQAQHIICKIGYVFVLAMGWI